MGRESRREREKRERREAIIDAAEQVFFAKGVLHATMDEVASVAEVSKGTLYLYFGSKDELLLALTHRPLGEALRRFRKSLKDESFPNGLALVEHLLRTQFDVITKHPNSFRLVMGSLCGAFEVDRDSASSQTYAENVMEMRSIYLDAIARGQRDGSIRDEIEPERLGVALWANVVGATVVWLASQRTHTPYGPRIPSDRVMPNQLELVLHALRVPGTEGGKGGAEESQELPEVAE